jgi:hypothetical protein
VEAFDYEVRERNPAGHEHRVGTYAHAAGEDPLVEGAVIVVYGKMWRIIEVRDGRADPSANALLVEAFADPG